MVILGLLSHEDLSGYDIKKKIDEQIRFFWKGSFGSIYPALAAMEEAGMVKRISAASAAKDMSTEKRDAEEPSLPGIARGGREKIFYRITDAGKKELREWLEDSMAVNDLKYETLLKLFFGGNVEKEITVKSISAFEAEIKESLALLKLYKANLEKVLHEKDHVYFYLTVSFGVASYEAYLKWCKEAKTMLLRV